MNEGEHISEQLSAYLDGELDDAQARAVEAALASDAELAAELESLRKTRDLVRHLPRAKASGDFVADVLAAAERVRLVDAPAAQAPAPSLKWVRYLATAAVLLITVGVAMIVMTVALTGNPDGNAALSSRPPAESRKAPIALAARDVADKQLPKESTLRRSEAPAAKSTAHGEAATAPLALAVAKDGGAVTALKSVASPALEKLTPAKPSSSPADTDLALAAPGAMPAEKAIRPAVARPLRQTGGEAGGSAGAWQATHPTNAAAPVAAAPAAAPVGQHGGEAGGPVMAKAEGAGEGAGGGKIGPSTSLAVADELSAADRETIDTDDLGRAVNEVTAILASNGVPPATAIEEPSRNVPAPKAELSADRLEFQQKAAPSQNLGYRAQQTSRRQVQFVAMVDPAQEQQVRQALRNMTSRQAGTGQGGVVGPGGVAGEGLAGEKAGVRNTKELEDNIAQATTGPVGMNYGYAASPGLVKNGAGTLDLNGTLASSAGNAVTLGGGSLAMGSQTAGACSTLTNAPTGVVTVSNGALTISPGTFPDSTLTNGTANAISGQTIYNLNTTTGATAANGTLTLSGANTYSGGTTISGGALALGSTGALNNSAALQAGNQQATGTANFSGGTVTINGGTIQNGGLTNSRAAPTLYAVILNGGNTFSPAQAGEVTVNGSVWDGNCQQFTVPVIPGNGTIPVGSLTSNSAAVGCVNVAATQPANQVFVIQNSSTQAAGNALVSRQNAQNSQGQLRQAGLSNGPVRPLVITVNLLTGGGQAGQPASRSSGAWQATHPANEQPATGRP